MEFFDIRKGIIGIWGYSLSYLELTATLVQAVAVWLEAKGKVLSWPLGIVSVILLFFLFFQIQLYPDMFLQVFYFFTFVLGWWRWTHPKPSEEDRNRQLKVSWMTRRELVYVSLLGLAGTMLFGALASRLHTWLPVVFSKPSAFPYLDSFVSIMSVITTFLLVQKKIENWIFWIAIDAVAAALYVAKGVRFLGIEYVVFCLIAAYGLYHWIREYRSYHVRV